MEKEKVQDLDPPRLFTENKLQMKHSLYMYRPHDFSVFINNGDDEYTHSMNIERMWQGHHHPYETLKGYGFIECTEDDFGWLKEKHELHTKYVAWAHRSDGHGGTKGGTMEEYLESKRNNDENRRKDKSDTG